MSNTNTNAALASPGATRRKSVVRVTGARERSFSIRTTTESYDPTASSAYDTIDEAFWMKLIRASEGQETLNVEDARKIINALQEEEEEVSEARVVSTIIDRLKSKDQDNNNIDEGFLQFLSENYNQLRSKYSNGIKSGATAVVDEVLSENNNRPFSVVS